MIDKETKNESSAPGFLFGLTLGAAVGALSAILVSKNSEKEIVQAFESKVKDFFQDLMNNFKSNKEEKPQEIRYIAVKEDIEVPQAVVQKKPAPKMFVKAKR